MGFAADKVNPFAFARKPEYGTDWHDNKTLKMLFKK